MIEKIELGVKITKTPEIDLKSHNDFLYKFYGCNLQIINDECYLIDSKGNKHELKTSLTINMRGQVIKEV